MAKGAMRLRRFVVVAAPGQYLHRVLHRLRDGI